MDIIVRSIIQINNEHTNKKKEKKQKRNVIQRKSRNTTNK